MSYPILLPVLAFLGVVTPAQRPIDTPLAASAAQVKLAPTTYADVESAAIQPDAAANDRTIAAPMRTTTSAVSNSSVLDRVAYDRAADGTVWARGRAYKASFGADGTTYVPFLGSHAPRNFPVSLHVVSVTIDGTPLSFDASVSAVHSGDVVEYDRGSFRERYVLSPGDVEQSFVFDALPRVGELVVTLDVHTELARAVDEHGFRFENELGHVRYARASAYPEGASPMEIASTLDGDVIRIVAPASLVARASGRFVVDPLLSTYAVDASLVDDLAADTAYDVTNGVWVTVSEYVFSATDHDINAVRHTTGGTISGQDWVDVTGTDWRAPAIANNNIDDQFLVVAERGDAPNREIWGRTVEATVSLNMSAQFAISELGSNGDHYAPDVGGDSSGAAPSYYAVVWEREFAPGVDYDILARLVRTDTTLVGAGNIGLENTAFSLHRNPSVSNSNGNATNALQDWNVVWELEVTSTNHNIMGARLHWDGTITDRPFAIASSGLDERNPSATSIVDDTGGTRPWMVAFQIDNGANNWDVRCRTLDGTSIISTFDLSSQFASPTLDQITPSCDTDGDQFVVAYDERATPLFFSTDVKVSTLYSLGGALGLNEGNVSVTPGLFNDRRPQIVTTASSGSSLDDALIVFDRDVGATLDVYASGYDLPNGGPVTSYCSGDGSGTACPCGNSGSAGKGCANSANGAGAQLSVSGNADLSADTLVLVASGMPATSPTLFFQGTTQTVLGAGAAFGDGLRCASGTVIRLGVKTASGGSASIGAGLDPNISVAGAVPAAGAVRNYQGWYRDSASFCSASTFNLTNGLRVQWIP